MPAPNKQKLERLRYLAWTQQQSLLLQHYLQARNISRQGTVELNKLFKSAVLVTISCNRMTVSPYKLLEVGIATFDRRSVTENGLINTYVGPQAENYLNMTWFMHFRMKEHAHLLSGTGSHGDNHFGTSVYVSKAEICDWLTYVWTQLLDEERPELGARPIILLQHGSVYGSQEDWNELGFDPAKKEATIALLDSQVIVDQAKVTKNPFAEMDYLLRIFKIDPYDPGNSGNAAAYITIFSMLSSLRKHLYQSPLNPKAKSGEYGQSSSKTAQAVANERIEQPTPVPPIGTQVYCHRCESWEHWFAACPKKDYVCTLCQVSKTTWRRENAESHKEGLCIFFRPA